MLDVMIKKNGELVNISPYKWIYTEDGLPGNPQDPANPRVFYIRLENGQTVEAYYNGTVLDKWLLITNNHVVLNEGDIVAWRYQRPR